MEDSEVLGPFLCRAISNSMGFWFTTGTRDVKSLEVYFSGTRHSVILKKIEHRDSYNCWIGEIQGLDENKSYSYSIKLDEVDYTPNGLSAGDLKFTTLSRDSSLHFDFFLMRSQSTRRFVIPLNALKQLVN